MFFTHLSRYPHIVAKIESTWGTLTCRNYLIELLSDSRDGTRVGFPPEVAKEIFSNLTKHDELFPKYDDSQNVVASRQFVSMPTRQPAVVTPATAVINPVFDVIKWVIVAVLVIGVLKKFIL